MKYNFNKPENNQEDDSDDDDGLPIVTEPENDTTTIQDELDIPTLDA